MPLKDKQSESRSEILNLKDRETGFRDVDDAINDRSEDQNAQKLRSSGEKSPKLKRAAEISAKSTAEIKAMAVGRTHQNDSRALYSQDRCEHDHGCPGGAA
jgi:hypothetical protein